MLNPRKFFNNIARLDEDVVMSITTSQTNAFRDYLQTDLSNPSDDNQALMSLFAQALDGAITGDMVDDEQIDLAAIFSYRLDLERRLIHLRRLSTVNNDGSHNQETLETLDATVAEIDSFWRKWDMMKQLHEADISCAEEEQPSGDYETDDEAWDEEDDSSEDEDDGSEGDDEDEEDDDADDDAGDTVEGESEGDSSAEGEEDNTDDSESDAEGAASGSGSTEESSEDTTEVGTTEGGTQA